MGDVAVGLYAKVAEVQKHVEGVEKRGHAAIQSQKASYSYDYILESDLMAAIRPKLAELGVAVFYSDEVVRYPQQGDNLTVVKVSVTLVDGETKERETMSAEGYGTDYGDKAANKAKTSAMRYLLWKWFLVPSDVDPEQENLPRYREASGEDVQKLRLLLVENGISEERIERGFNAARGATGGVLTADYVAEQTAKQEALRDEKKDAA